MEYRRLKDDEIRILKNKSNHCDDWDNVLVKEGFDPETIERVKFAGLVRLGVFNGEVNIESNIKKRCGIFDSFITNCTIDDNVYISNVNNLIGYHIKSHTIIDRVYCLAVLNETTFGNGTILNVVNEGGGREIKIFDRLSSQIAYLQTFYKHDEEFTRRIDGLIDEYVRLKKSDSGVIGEGTRIINSKKIVNVWIGNNVTIEGSSLLENGTIMGSKYEATVVGCDVIAKNFIIQSGSVVDGGAVLDNTFIGQGVRIGKQFSAENSCFFANSEGFHGEACSLFAGPYTVSHHKSTLLIAMMASFYNAGSGSNQSNHMYKLGPIHQGILERGTKTGSFSYMMWPCHIGPFSVVIGKHYSNLNTSDFPFSYIIESKGKSLLIPAVNLFTVGTRRDGNKWPKRDRRNDPERYDMINFEILSPYTVSKILSGMETLKKIEEQYSKDHHFVEWDGFMIERSRIKESYERYNSAVNIYIGNEFIKKLKSYEGPPSIEKIKEYIIDLRPTAYGKWLDISGMFTPERSVKELVENVKKRKIRTIDGCIEKIGAIYRDYDKNSWAWCLRLIENRYNTESRSITKGLMIQIIEQWRKDALKLNEMILMDAEKEFSENKRIGYGIDGDEDTNIRDFKEVVGSFENNRFVIEIKQESESIKKKAEELIAYIKSLSE